MNPKDNERDIEEEDGESKKGYGKKGQSGSFVGLQCRGRQENSLRTVQSYSRVLYTNTGWSVHSLGQVILQAIGDYALL